MPETINTPDANQPPPKLYIGDGVYVSPHCFGIALETRRENGTNLIVLGGSEFENLVAFAETYFGVEITIRERETPSDTSSPDEAAPQADTGD